MTHFLYDSDRRGPHGLVSACGLSSRIDSVSWFTVEQDKEWSAKIAAQIGKQVARIRAPEGGERRMTAQALADRCTELGLTFDRAVIAKLERGSRQTITVGEVLVLAKALGVPPLWLIFPAGDEDEFEALPGQVIGTWDAARWFTGEASFPSELIPGGEVVDGLADYYDDPEAGWEEGAAPLHLRRKHDQATAEYFKVPQHVRDMGRDERESYQLLSRLRRPLEETLRTTREEMRKRGLTPPRLAAGLEHIDELASSQEARRVIGDL